MTRFAFLLLFTSLILGCGPASRDTGKNRDMDRPKPAGPAK